MSSFNYHENYRFYNPFEPDTKRTIVHFFLWMIGFYKDKKKSLEIPPNFSYPNKDEKNIGKYSVQWINHSTFIVKCDDVLFLTDPVWTEKLSIIGPKRHFQPPISIKDLPKIDYVIISHNHYDHLDKETIFKLLSVQKKLNFIVPSGLKKWFHKYFPETNVFELHWWETKEISGIQFTAVPSQHFSGRGLFDTDKTLWMGCVVKKGDKQFYFAGDTGYNAYDFKKMGEHFGKIDLSLLPIGAYLPRGFMAPVHINPEEAVQIHKEVNSIMSVGGHFGTFKLSKEKMEQPPYDLFLALQKENLSWENFRILKPGQAISW